MQRIKWSWVVVVALALGGGCEPAWAADTYLACDADVRWTADGYTTLTRHTGSGAQAVRLDGNANVVDLELRRDGSVLALRARRGSDVARIDLCQPSGICVRAWSAPDWRWQVYGFGMSPDMRALWIAASRTDTGTEFVQRLPDGEPMLSDPRVFDVLVGDDGTPVLLATEAGLVAPDGASVPAVRGPVRLSRGAHGVYVYTPGTRVLRWLEGPPWRVRETWPEVRTMAAECGDVLVTADGTVLHTFAEATATVAAPTRTRTPTRTVRPSATPTPAVAACEAAIRAAVEACR